MEILLISVIALPWLGALVVWLLRDIRPNVQHAAAVAFSAAAGICALALIPSAGSGLHVSLPMGSVFGDFVLAPDGLGIFLTAVATVIGCLAVVFSVDYMRGERQLGRYYALVLFFIGAMAGLVLTSNLLLMFLFWEITALCSYSLISFYNDDPKAVAGGVKALLITSVGGVGLLVAALLVHSYTGSYDILALAANPQALPPDVLRWMAFGCLAAAAAKSAQVPFQTWLPDAMEAPSPISALIHAATMVNAGVYLLARLYPAFAEVPGWRLAVMAVGMLSALLAALMALTASDLKRTLAYSTISQLGYMVYAVGAGGIFASQFHLLSHAVFKALLFLAAGAVIHSVGTRDMRLMGGLGGKMPFLRGVFVIGALALAGVPILNGFWSKELVLEAGMTGGPLWIWIIMLVVAGMTALYTTRMVWLVFFGAPRAGLHVHPSGLAMKIALIPLAAGALSTWLLAGPFSKMLAETLPAHGLHAEPTSRYLAEVVGNPLTLLALAVIGLGAAAWWQRERFAEITNGMRILPWLAERSFGLETLNQIVVDVTRFSAETLRLSQTGLLNWNILGIFAGLVIVLAVLAGGV